MNEALKERLNNKIIIYMLKNEHSFHLLYPVFLI